MQGNTTDEPIKRIPIDSSKKPPKKIFAILNDLEKKLEIGKNSSFSDCKTIFGSINSLTPKRDSSSKFNFYPTKKRAKSSNLMEETEKC